MPSLFKVVGYGAARLLFVWLQTVLKSFDRYVRRSYLEAYYQFLPISKARFMGFSYFSALLGELQ